MNKRCVLLGNGESRIGLDIDFLKKKSIVWACNAAYRDIVPHRLVSVDIKISHEVYRSGYAFENVCYFRDWSRLPATAYENIVSTDLISQKDRKDLESFINESERKENEFEFVLSGQDLDKMLEFRKDYLKKHPNARPEDINSVLGKEQAGLWITWCPSVDKVIQTESLPGCTDYGFCSGALSSLLASYYDQPDEIYLVGHDLYSESGNFVNNVYKGTDCYIDTKGSEIPPVNWIHQHKLVFQKFSQIKFFKVNKKPLNSNDRINREIEEWKDVKNLSYTTQDEMINLFDEWPESFI